MKFHDSITKAFGRDEDLEKNGVFLEFPNPFGATIRIKIARAGGSNDNFHLAFAKRTQGLQGLSLIDTLPAEQRRKIWQEIYFDSIVLAWENILDAEGNEVPLTKENFLDFCEQYGEIWDQIFSSSREFSNFKEKVETVTKN